MTEQEAKDKAGGSPPTEDLADFTKRRATFTYRWTAPNGDEFTGPFTNRVASVGDLGEIGRLSSVFNGGQPYASIPPLYRNLNNALAHLSVTLESRPKWAKELSDLIHNELIFDLYRVVEVHEGIFRGRITPEETGSGEGEES